LALLKKLKCPVKEYLQKSFQVSGIYFLNLFK
jgi:hypothetical protein